MKSLLGIVIALLLPLAASTKAPTELDNLYPFLEFIELKQFTGNFKANFDLSGLAIDKNKNIYAISDKQKNHFIYNLNWKDGTLKPHLDIRIKDKLDIEAIDICNSKFYLSNERNNKFYVVQKDTPTETIAPDYTPLPQTDLVYRNRGFEGLAVDCKNQTMYVTKERQPRYILTIDMKTKKIVKRWDIPETDAFDYSDAKFENGHLYLLERSGMLVTKVDVATEKVVAKFSYRNLEKYYGYLFGPAIYPFAEALLLTEDEIWIGFDNNGLKVTPKASEDLGVKGRDPIVMRFKRPKDF